MTEPKYKIGDFVIAPNYEGNDLLIVMSKEYNGEIGTGVIETQGEEYQYELRNPRTDKRIWLFEKHIVKRS